MMLRNHTDVLNYLATLHNLQSYLELGINIPANNFDKIKAKNKTGVDPKFVRNDILITTSDLFFDWNEKGFDLVFIDGDHTYEQVKKDFENSVKVLNEGGFIVLHDTVPIRQIDTFIPRQTKKWNGDVYRFALDLINYKGIRYCTLPFDSGITIVKIIGNLLLPFAENNYGWNFYMKNKKLLNLISTQDFVKWVNKKQLV